MLPDMYKAIVFGMLALGIGACAPTTRTTVTLDPYVSVQVNDSNLITGLRPDRGEGSNYAVGEAVRLLFSARTPGYVTLIALQSNGYASTLVQNAYVDAGTTVFPRAEDGVVYNLGQPRGVQRVRAIFTRVRPTSSIVLSGSYDSTRWNSVTTAYLDPYASSDRDVQETYLYIR